MLAVDDDAAAASYRSTTHFQEFRSGVRAEDKVLIGAHKYKDNHEQATND